MMCPGLRISEQQPIDLSDVVKWLESVPDDVPDVHSKFKGFGPYSMSVGGIGGLLTTGPMSDPVRTMVTAALDLKEAKLRSLRDSIRVTHEVAGRAPFIHRSELFPWVHIGTDGMVRILRPFTANAIRQVPLDQTIVGGAGVSPCFMLTYAFAAICRLFRW